MVTGAGAGRNFSSTQIAGAVRQGAIATLCVKTSRMIAFAQNLGPRPERTCALSIRIPTGACVIHEWQQPRRWSSSFPRRRPRLRETTCQHLYEVLVEIAVGTPCLPVGQIDASDPFLKMLGAFKYCS